MTNGQLIKKLKKLPKDVILRVGVAHEDIAYGKATLQLIDEGDGPWIALIGKKENDD